MSRPHGPRWVLAIVVVLLLVPFPVIAQRLPITGYSTAEGLAHNRVNSIVRDSRGFLWLATEDGLSRFDGNSFTNYSVEHGLPHRSVTDLLETRSGELWVATLGGLVRFNVKGVPSPRRTVPTAGDTARALFVSVALDDPDPRAHAVLALLESRDGTIWCGTRKGLYRLRRDGDTVDLVAVDVGMPSHAPLERYVNAMLEDAHGTLWCATPSGLYRRWSDGSAARYSMPEGLPDEHYHDLMTDRRGQLWVGSRNAGFFRLSIDASPAPPTVAEAYGYPNDLPSPWVAQLRQTSDGRFWIATARGLVEFLPDGTSAKRVRLLTVRNGLTHYGLTALGEDAGGNLWVGTGTNGAMKIARTGFVSYGQHDRVMTVADVFSDVDGTVYFRGNTVAAQPTLTLDGNAQAGGEDIPPRFGRFDGQQIEWFAPRAPFDFGWAPERTTLRTRDGEWWVAGGAGLYRFPPLASFSAIRNTAPLAVYTTRDGLGAAQVWRLFEDSTGAIWISTIGSPSAGLVRWDRWTRKVTNFSNTPSLPSLRADLPRAFGEDAAGNVWIGFNTGVARYRDRSFTFFSATDGGPAGPIMDIHSDRAQRLWIGTAQSGLVRVDGFEQARPVFRQYTTAQGLSSNSVAAVTDDLYDRLYVATSRGLDRLTPGTGHVRHFTTADGLAPGSIISAYRDPTGVLWIGTQSGLSRFVPDPPERQTVPAVLITSLTVATEPQLVSATGETAVALGDLSPARNQLQVDFVALGLTIREGLRFQYRLEGADRDWGPATEQQRVSLASLAPGRYRFLVRAVTADGAVGNDPAVVAFTVLPQLWQRWWFLSATAVALGLTMVALHRYRLARLLELERLRTRIATDLHDDIGANLTRIAILTEVVRQPLQGDATELHGPLSSISRIARESVDAMSDIVWAITPDRDTLRDVVRRMRDHAEEVFETRDVGLTLTLPDDGQYLKLGVNVRRDLYLIFKEAVNNTARHASCARVAIGFRQQGTALVLEVVDDGVGFAVDGESDGNGLTSMRKRADRLGGTLEVRSSPGHGTTVRLTMPLYGMARATGPHPTHLSR